MAEKKKKNKLLIGSVIGVLVAIVAGMAIWALPFVYNRASEAQVVYIYPNNTKEQVADSLSTYLGATGKKVATVLSVVGYDIEHSVGMYRIEKGMTPIDIARKIRRGAQDPLRFTFNNVRTKEQFAQKVGEKFLVNAEDVLKVLNDEKFCEEHGKTVSTVVCGIMPDTYEFFWDYDAETIVGKLLQVSEKFWTDERKVKAKALGLTPDEVVIVASIAEEESAKRDERGKIGRLYINRLQGGMPLQADPTVKFALGDFAIRRILTTMTEVDNPYNTYRYAGLPPGPIRFVEKATIDAVLNSDAHNYLYMCAKEDFSGYHNFTASYSEHLANAAKYRRELNNRGIK